MSPTIHGKSDASFAPPPGSIMVTKVINVLKKKYRFVDLLKPENYAVVPILLAIHPKLASAINAVILQANTIGNRKTSPARPSKRGQLSYAQSDRNSLTLESSLAMALGNDAQLFNLPLATKGELSMADSWEKVTRLSDKILSYVDDSQGFFNAKRSEGVDKLLHVGLRRWRGNLAIDKNQEVPEYLEAAMELAKLGGFRIVVFGHTHLPKSIEFQVNGVSSTYFNSGTWVDTMSVPVEVLSADAIGNQSFNRFVDDLKHNRIEQYVTTELSYVYLSMTNEKVTEASLHAFKAGESIVGAAE